MSRLLYRLAHRVSEADGPEPGIKGEPILGDQAIRRLVGCLGWTLIGLCYAIGFTGIYLLGIAFGLWGWL